MVIAVDGVKIDEGRKPRCKVMRRKADTTNGIQSQRKGQDVYSSPATPSSSLFSALSEEDDQ